MSDRDAEASPVEARPPAAETLAAWWSPLFCCERRQDGRADGGSGGKGRVLAIFSMARCPTRLRQSGIEWSGCDRLTVQGRPRAEEKSNEGRPRQMNEFLMHFVK
uniref:Uncharacterized protein n=1 Tax=Arundo donax TaxID=35708 RepID=A0A0A9DE06_ARUDO